MGRKKVVWGDDCISKQGNIQNVFSVRKLDADTQFNIITIQYEEGIVVNDFRMSMEAAIDIGFIDFSKLEGKWDSKKNI